VGKEKGQRGKAFRPGIGMTNKKIDMEKCPAQACKSKELGFRGAIGGKEKKNLNTLLGGLAGKFGRGTLGKRAGGAPGRSKDGLLPGGLNPATPKVRENAAQLPLHKMVTRT